MVESTVQVRRTWERVRESILRFMERESVTMKTDGQVHIDESPLTRSAAN